MVYDILRLGSTSSMSQGWICTGKREEQVDVLMLGSL